MTDGVESLTTSDKSSQVGDDLPAPNSPMDTESTASSLSDHTKSTSDKSYNPDEDEGGESDADADLEQFEEPESRGPLHKERKFIVFISSLMALLSWCHCPRCGCQDISSQLAEVGTLVIMTLTCSSCQGRSLWHSQPYCHNTPAGNILLSAAILFAGATATKVMRIFRHMNLACITTRTFFRHQNNILIPAVHTVWNRQQQFAIAMLQSEQRDAVLGGDGRADSPGYSAKYGSYTTMELESNIVLDIQLVQSNQCGGSYHMEKMGLQKSVEFLLKDMLHIGTIITDRHRQIGSWIAENLQGCRHLYDIWHVAKGLRKKLQAIAKEKGCEVLREWIDSIINHLYWCVVSSPSDSPELVLAKWKSVLNHLQNKHTGHEDPLFPDCTHALLSGREARKKWIQPSSKLAVKLEKVVMSKSLLKDIQKLSGEHQTSVVEAFHSLIIQFAPKSIVFSFSAMKCRLELAALHYNENGGRSQARTKDGKLQFKIRYPKYKKGGYIVQRRQTAATYGKLSFFLEQYHTAF